MARGRSLSPAVALCGRSWRRSPTPPLTTIRVPVQSKRLEVQHEEDGAFPTALLGAGGLLMGGRAVDCRVHPWSLGAAVGGIPSRFLDPGGAVGPGGGGGRRRAALEGADEASIASRPGRLRRTGNQATRPALDRTKTRSHAVNGAGAVGHVGRASEAGIGEQL